MELFKTKPIRQLSIYWRLAVIIILAFTYYGVSYICRTVASTPQSVTPVWAADGFASGAVLLLGIEVLPGVMLGSFLANVWAFFNDQNLIASIFQPLGIAIGTTLGTWLGSFLFNQKFNQVNPLTRLRYVYFFLLFVGLIGPVVNASFGVVSLYLGGQIKLEVLPKTWITWWISNVTGILIFTPALLSWGYLPWRKISNNIINFLQVINPQTNHQTKYNLKYFRNLRKYFNHKLIIKYLEFIGVITISIVISNMAFIYGYAIEYMLICCLEWATFRLGQFFTTNLSVVVLAIAVIGTINGGGSFFKSNINDSLLLLQSFITVLVTSNLVLAAILAEKQQAIDHLTRSKQKILTSSQLLEQKQLEIKTYLLDLERQFNQTLLLKNIAEKIHQNLGIEPIFNATVTELGRVIQADRCLIYTCTEKNPLTLNCRARYISHNISDVNDLVIDLKTNQYLAKIISQDEPIISDNIYQEELLKSHLEFCEKINLKSIISIRTSYQGEFNGIITIHQCHNFRTWQESDIEILKSVANQLGIAMAQAALLEQEKAQKLLLSQFNIELIKAKSEAELANRAKSEFLTNMSHELRTPLNAIFGLVELMQTNDNINQSQREDLTIVEHSASHLLHLINDILDISKIESGKLELYLSSVNLRGFFQDIIIHYQSYASQTKINFTYELADNFPEFVSLDSRRLKQILFNLLSNAFKFTQTGKVTLSVNIESEITPILPANQARSTTQFIYDHNISYIDTKNNADTVILVIDVEDTGAGITNEDLQRIFLPFEQVASTRLHSQGTGLGLAISQKLADMMHGQITVKSQFGKGSKFTVSIKLDVLKMNRESTPSGESKSVFALSNDILAHRFPLEILLAEDNVVNQKVTTRLCQRLGYTVDLAENGLEVLAKLQQKKYDVILMDIQMPEMDGLEATRRIITELSPSERPYIIAVTANAMSVDRDDCLAAGMNDYISKPLRLERLIELLNELQEKMP
ncbi:MAG: MASE1 domain-containing protein [Pseudanabaena sp. ELA607]